MKNKARESCIGCGHRRPLAASHPNINIACHYMLDTGKIRDCPASQCKYYTTKECHVLDDFRFSDNIFQEDLWKD